jgi:hypothetical protein
MRKSKAYAAHDELAKPQQSAGETLEAPIQLTPEQLEIVAAGFKAQLSTGGGGGTATTGLYPSNPTLKMY